MKRFLIILIFLALAVPSYAQEWQEARMTLPMLSGEVAAAGPTGFCASATATVGGIAGLLCEDFEGAVACSGGYSSNCRGAWSIDGGTPDFDYATPIEGTYSLNIPAYATTSWIGLHRGWTATEGATHWIYAQIKTVNLPAVETSKTFLILRASSSNSCILRFRNNGSGVVVQVEPSGGSTADTVSTLSEGTTYHFWFSYLRGTGANAVCTAAFSTDGTRPTSGNNLASSTNGTGQADIDNISFEVEYSSGGQCSDIVVDKIIVDDATIGNNPA